MPAKAKARSAAAQVFGPSLTRATDLTITNVDVSAPLDFANTCVVWGTATTAPATYADLSSPQHLALAGCDVVNFEDSAGGPVIKELTVKNATVAGTPGAHLWVGFVSSTSSPVSGTTIDAVADAGVLLA